MNRSRFPAVWLHHREGLGNYRHQSSLIISAKPDGVGAACQQWIVKGARSGLLTRIAATESVSLCVRMKSSRRFYNSNRWFALEIRRTSRKPFKDRRNYQPRAVYSLSGPPALY